jgi:hypothetical protein
MAIFLPIGLNMNHMEQLTRRLPLPSSITFPPGRRNSPAIPSGSTTLIDKKSLFDPHRPARAESRPEPVWRSDVMEGSMAEAWINVKIATNRFSTQEVRPNTASLDA